MKRESRGQGAAEVRSDENRSVGRFGPAAVVAALALSIFTFVVFAGFTPVIPTPPVVLAIFSGNALIIAVLLALIALETRKVIAARRAGRAGARLHSRVVALFSLVAAVPALVTAVVATVSLERVLNPVFMEDIRSFIGRTIEATRLYRESQCRSLLRDAELTASDLSQSANLFQTDRNLFHSYLNSRAKFLNFSVALILKPNGEIEDHASDSDPTQVAKPAAQDFEDAKKNAALCLLLADGKVFIALRAIPGIDDSYLYVGRPIDPFSESFSHDAAEVVTTYDRFDTHRRNIELGFGIMFVLLALTMLLAAIWLGLAFANQLVAPIRRLIRAADEVASGNLYVQVPTRRAEGDLGHLGATFNKMTQELSQQQNRLIAANALNDERRAFIEAVLAGVPAGVIGVDHDGVIRVRNAAADRLLAPLAPNDLAGVKLESLLPDVGPILKEARESRMRLHQGQAKLQRDGRERVLNVRVTSNPQRPDQGAVVTLDDISDLITAQRTAAWADVARRIAHEIKNPLTPIQLSAERLKRKYLKEIRNDPDTFTICTETIIRHVGDIGRMVDEFSSFARMPAPTIKEEDLVEIVRQAVFLQRTATPEIRFEVDVPNAAQLACDARQVSQALVNLLKNAAESIQARDAGAEPGHIAVRLVEAAGQTALVVEDNGRGLPQEGRERLAEPYVTTRTKGTGLGLAIVKKIMEDHGGELMLEDREGGGARVSLVFNRNETRTVHSPSEQEIGNTAKAAAHGA